MKKRKFAAGGTPALDDLVSGEMEGGFSNKNKDVYARARDVIASRLNEGEEQPAKAPVKRAPKTETKPSKSSESSYKDTSSRFPSRYEEAPSRFPSKYEEAPVSRAGSGSRAGPTIERAAKMARDKAAEDEMMRPGRDAIEGVYPEAMLLGGAGALRSAAGALTSRMAAKKSAQDAVEASKAFSAPRAPEVAKSAEKYTPKQQMEAAESAMRGATNRAKIAGKRAEEKELPNEILEILRRPRSSKIADTLGGGKATKTRGEDALEKIFNKRDADFKRGGKVKKYASGGSVSSASSRGDGIAQRGKTKGRMY